MKKMEDIDALIGKFLSGEALPEEAMALEDWLKESEDNYIYYRESLKAMGLNEVRVSSDVAWTKVNAQLKQTPIRRLRFGWISAAAAVLIVAFGTFFWLTGESEPQVFNATAKKEQIELNDGTDIQLAAHSSIELTDGYGTENRSLKLKGSAYFSVKHSEKLPFVIEAGPIHIKDLGTKFDVKTTEDTIYVRVDEGVVMIYDNKGMKITLKANESAHYVIASGKLEVDLLTEALKDDSKTVVFDDQRLEDVITILNRVYDADIRIENPALKNCRITTEFKNEDLETVLMIIAQTLEVTIRREGDVYWVKGAACSQ